MNQNNKGIEGTFFKYVIQNIIGMIGLSAYVIVDTVFISVVGGADGITALNLVLPIYSLIFAIGSMIGTGSAIRFKILRSQNDKSADSYFTNAIISVFTLSIPFVVAGALFPDRMIALMGADETIVRVGKDYTRIFMVFAPVFMSNHVFNAFVRNDNNPLVAMTATFSSSIFNIVFDYILMFKLGMGIQGAALATALSPIVGIVICLKHFLSKKNTIKIVFAPSVRKSANAAVLGISSFVGEISSGVTTVVFNYLILSIAGNIGVAAYGVIANCAIVAIALFNGVAQGMQPLLSEKYGKKDNAAVKKLLMYGIGFGTALAGLVVIIAYLFTNQIIAVFNSENSTELVEYAYNGMKLYSLGFLFAAFNIVGTGYLSATNRPLPAFLSSISRGVVAIVVCAVTFAFLFGMNGIWLAFLGAEVITAVITILGISGKLNRKNV